MAQDPADWPPGPARDRALAHRARHGPRWAQDFSRMVDHWMRSPEVKRLARLRKVGDVVAGVLAPHERERIEIVSVHQGTLTIAVADTMLLSELRNHRQHELVHELVEQGTGVGRVRFRLARSAPQRGRRR